MHICASDADFSKTDDCWCRALASAPLGFHILSRIDRPTSDVRRIYSFWGLRGQVGPAEGAVPHLNTDSAYIATAKWDLWELKRGEFEARRSRWCSCVWTVTTMAWPQGRAFRCDLGFEHFLPDMPVCWLWQGLSVDSSDHRWSIHSRWMAAGGNEGVSQKRRENNCCYWEER